MALRTGSLRHPYWRRVIVASMLLGTACGNNGGTDAGSRSPDAEASTGGDHSTGGHGECPPPASSLEIVARDTTFDADCLAAPAGEAFAIAFANEDAETLHNVAIFSEDPMEDPDAEVLFQGEIITGPGSITYQVDALDAGTYHFHCDVHPEQMVGTLIVD